MEYDITLKLPESWQKETERYTDESGAEITHLEAHLYAPETGRDEAVIDIYVGPLPEDTTAEDQAFSNYADIVGFYEDDPEDFNPVSVRKFNGKKAYGFQGYCENDYLMCFLSQEIRSGILAIICCTAPDQEHLDGVIQLVERNLRLNATQSL